VVDMVTLEDAYWTDLPEKEEAGTPDIVGVVALGKAIRLFQSLGWEAMIQHEAKLTAYALQQLKQIPEVTLYGDINPANAAQRLGVISFNFGDLPHALVAAILSYEGAIGVRAGCFCAQPYVKSILRVSDKEGEAVVRQILERDRSNLPGAVRISFGLYNSKDEIDRLIEMLHKIASGDYSREYVLNKEKGEYVPKGFQVEFGEYFGL